MWAHPPRLSRMASRPQPRSAGSSHPAPTNPAPKNPASLSPAPARLNEERSAMTPRFFIDRPVFAWVIALGIVLAGLMALKSLPIEQYPSVAPPSLTIAVTYPGADAEVLETNVTQVIEQELNGVENFLYMSATSRSNGTASITLTFQAGTDIDVAQMDVQNRLQRVEQRLPDEVRRQGIPVNKASSGFL